MATFKVTIRCDNAAFDGDPEAEIGRILRELADNIEATAADKGRLMDINGNHVGEWTYVGDGEHG